MDGDVNKFLIGHCSVCNAPVYSYTKEGYRCFSIKSDCSHKDAKMVRLEKPVKVMVKPVTLVIEG